MISWLLVLVGLQQFSSLQPSSPARSAHASWNGSPNLALHYIQSVVNSKLDGYPFPQFRGPHERPALGGGSTSRERTVMPVAAQTGLPGLLNSILPDFPPILPLALRSRIGRGSWSVVPPSRKLVSATCPSLAPPSEPADWVAVGDVTSLRVSGN